MNFVFPTVQKIKKQAPSVKKEPTVQKLKKQAPSLKKEVSNEEGHKRNSAVSRMAALEDENENLKLKVEAVSKAFTNYVTKNEFESQDSVTNLGMVQLETFMTAVKEEAGKMTQIVMSLQEDLNSKTEENCLLRSEIEVLKDNFTVVKEEAGKMTQDVMSLQEDLKSKTDDNRLLRSDIEVLKDNLSALGVQVEKNKKKDRISCNFCQKLCNSDNSFKAHMIAKHNNLQNLSVN